MHIGFTTTTLRQIKSLEKIVEIALDCGAECIEWGGDIHVRDVITAKKAKELCDKAGIRNSTYGSYYRIGNGNIDEWKNVCEIAHALGAHSVRVWLGSADSEKTENAVYDKLVSHAREMCAVAAEYGLNVAPECHDNTFNNNTDAFLKIQNDIGCDNFKTYFQSKYCRKDYDLDRIERTVKYVDCVHVSFFEQFREQFLSHKPLYMNEILKKLSDSGYNGDVMVEFVFFSYQYGVPSSLKREISRLKKILG